MKRLQPLSVFLVCLLAGAYVTAQESSPAPAAPPKGNQVRPEGMDRDTMREMFRNAVSGSIQSVSADAVTLKQMDGTVITVKTTKDTMFFRERQQAKLADFKAGDVVIVMGDKAADNSVTAKVFAVRPNGPGMMNPDDLGKKFIAGEVTKIEETKLTIKRPDGVEQVVEVDDDTSFKNAKRESATLADIKVGDNVIGRGELKNGTFTPATLSFGKREDFMMMRRQRREGEGTNAAPGTATPAPVPAPDKKTTTETTPK